MSLEAPGYHFRMKSKADFPEVELLCSELTQSAM